MRPETQLLFACTRQNFTSDYQQMVLALCQDAPIQWELVYRTALDHGVAPLIYTNLTHNCLQNVVLPPEIKDKFERILSGNMIRQSVLAHNLQKTLSFFHRRAIDILLLKGSALDILVYEQPWYTSHDVDLVLRPHRYMLNLQQQSEIDDFFAGLPGFEYEFYQHHDVVMNGLLPVDFSRIWQEAVQIRFRDQAVWVMYPEDLLLATCINACRKRYLRLKSLLDIAEIVNTHSDLDWDRLLAHAKTWECHNIVYTALMVTKMTVGCKVAKSVLDQFAVSPIRRQLLRWLITYLLKLTALPTPSLPSGPSLFGKHLTWSLILPYASYSPSQIVRRLMNFWE